MPIEDDKLVDAVSAAVDSATPPDVLETKTAAAPPQDDSGDGAPPAGDSPKPDEPQTGEAPPAEDKAPAGADPSADRGDGRNAQGKFVKKSGETEADFAKRAQAPEKGTPDPKKPPDHVNDPIPADVKGRTRERMEGLVGAAKTLTTERDTARAQLKEFNDAITATGADPDTFANHMTLLEAMLSPEPAQQREAIKLLRGAADRMAEDLGETPSGKDPLEGHADLLEDVENGDITRKRAVELAESRNRRKAEETRNQRTEAQTREQNEQQGLIQKARADLNALGAQLSSTDPLFAQKAKVLLPAVQAMAAVTHPSKWLGAYKAMYDKLDLGPQVRTNGDTRQRVPAGTGQRQPMRPMQGAGGEPQKTPTSLAEAIDFGINQAARR